MDSISEKDKENHVSRLYKVNLRHARRKGEELIWMYGVASDMYLLYYMYPLCSPCILCPRINIVETIIDIT